MKKKTQAIFSITILGGILLGLGIADLCTPDRGFSSYENRILASKPDFSLEELFGGSYTADYETYVTDQFVGRDQWITVKTLTDVTLGKKEVNGVYLGKDGYLIEKHAPEDISEETVLKRLDLLEQLADFCAERSTTGNFHVLIAPTADNVLTEKLPEHASYYRQDTLFEQIENLLGDESVINVTGTLNAHKDEYIYYRTDHHWTTYGAYLAYEEWAEKTGMTEVSYDTETLSEDFYGTLHSKTNLPVTPDVIEGVAEESLPDLQVYYDLGQTAVDTLYAEKHLATKNQYGYFLDDNHALVEIRNQEPGEDAAGKSLLIIKDSYANCFVPFLVNHYEKIYVLDLRYYNASLFGLIENYDPEGTMDVLVLYNTIHFLEEFRYY